MGDLKYAVIFLYLGEILSAQHQELSNSGLSFGISLVALVLSVGSIDSQLISG